MCGLDTDLCASRALAIKTANDDTSRQSSRLRAIKQHDDDDDLEAYQYSIRQYHHICKL